MRKKVYSIWLLVVALIAGAWSIPSPRSAAIAQPKLDATSPCNHATTQLVGRSADLPHVKNLIQDICDFHMRMDQIPSNVSEFDKDFIEDSITSNTLELQSLQIALSGATNEEWRGQIQMMIIMHTADLQQALAVAKKIGADTTPNLKHASVYPETPDYDLGKRFENLEEKYLVPLRAAVPGGPTSTPTGVPTGVPTDTVTATGIPTDTATATGVPTDTATATSLPTDTATMTMTATGTVTSVPTDTATSIPTDTATNTPTDTATTTATETATSTATDTATMTATETTTSTPTDTATLTLGEVATGVPSDTATGAPTGVPTDTATATSVPTTGPTVGSAFDILSLDILEDEHTADVQSELAAERLTKNDEIKAFAKHSADVTELHILLMSDLKHRMVDNFTPPPPEMQADYQSPRRFEPR